MSPRMAVAGLAGAMFGLGLVVAGMTSPAKVLGFLDVAGRWDPSLMFVLGAAVLAAWVGVTAARRRRAPLFAPAFLPPAAVGIDGALVAGALLFGTGWGLAGFCPGPALAALGLGSPGGVWFLAGMMGGMAVFTYASPSRRKVVAP